jgi:hypothetical protein
MKMPRNKRRNDLPIVFGKRTLPVDGVDSKRKLVSRKAQWRRRRCHTCGQKVVR